MLHKSRANKYIKLTVLILSVSAEPKKPTNNVPKIRYLSLDDFATIPKYMKGKAEWSLEFATNLNFIFAIFVKIVSFPYSRPAYGRMRPTAG